MLSCNIDPLTIPCLCSCSCSCSCPCPCPCSCSCPCYCSCTCPTMLLTGLGGCEFGTAIAHAKKTMDHIVGKEFSYIPPPPSPGLPVHAYTAWSLMYTLFTLTYIVVVHTLSHTFTAKFLIHTRLTLYRTFTLLPLSLTPLSRFQVSAIYLRRNRLRSRI